MSVLENLGKKISTTFENAQKDLRHSVAKSLSVAATTIATPSNKAQTAGNKTKLFSTILERSKRIRDHIIDHRNPTITERTPAAGITTSGGGVVARDDVQDKLATFARLEKEFSDLIEAYEILLVERVHLEEIMTGNSQLESLDDLELVGQYYKALQDATQVCY